MSGSRNIKNVLRAGILAVAIGASLSGCFTLSSLKPGVSPGLYDTFIVVRLTAETPDVQATLHIWYNGNTDFAFPFTPDGAISVIPVVQGSVKLLSVKIGRKIVDLDKLGGWKREIKVGPKEVVYLGDWRAFDKGGVAGIRAPTNFASDSRAELAAGYPALAKLTWKSYFTGDEDLKPGTLGKNQLALRTVTTVDGSVHPTPFQRAVITMGTLSDLGLLTDLTPDDQVRVMDSLFAGLPASTDDLLVLKEAVVGRARSDGSDLSLQIAAETLKESAKAADRRYAVALISNVLLDLTNGTATRNPGTDLAAGLLRFYAREYLLYADGRLVSAANLITPAQYSKLKDSPDPLDSVNFTDILIKSGRPEDLVLARDILGRLLSDPSTNVDVRRTAELNSVLLACAEGSLDTAGTLLEKLAAEDRTGLDPSFAKAIDVEAPALIRLCRASMTAAR